MHLWLAAALLAQVPLAPAVAPEAPETPQVPAAPPALDVAPQIVLRAELHGSLDATLRQVAPAYGSALAAQVARLLRWRGDIVKDLHPGDALRLVFSPTTEGPELVALAYEGAAVRLAAYRYTVDGVARFFDGEGRLVEPELQANPVPAYVQITETVQQGRGKRKHQGLDLKAPQGTPVLLPFDGVVSRVNWSRGRNGNCIEIVYARGMLARFLHLYSIDPAVQAGAKLIAGVSLGTVGSTGHSSAPHLHYELRSPSGEVLDPLQEHGTATTVLPEPLRQEFLALRHSLDALLGGIARTAPPSRCRSPS